jgi:hypothetical protein
MKVRCPAVALAAALACSTALPQMASLRQAPNQIPDIPRSREYRQIQRRLAQGWNTWDVHSVITHVLLPEGLAIHVSMKHNSTEYGDDYLQDALIGRLNRGAEQVTPGPHAWDGSYTDLRVEWHGHAWRVQSAHAGADGRDLVLLVTPLPAQAASALPPTVIFTVDFLWNRDGTVVRRDDSLEARGHSTAFPTYCTCAGSGSLRLHDLIAVPTGGPYFAADLTGPIGISTGQRRTVEEIQALLDAGAQKYRQTVTATGTNTLDPIRDAIQTTLGWDTIYEPTHQRVVSPVSRVWSVAWGGYVIFDWDTFFAATMAGIGDRDLAYADALETLREETPQGFVPNYARAGNWKSSDRSEPPVGAITVLGLYQQFHDRWFLDDAYLPLLRWNRWWDQHRQIQGYLAWGSDGDNQPANLDDDSRGTRAGAILESGLDNSPMYDAATYDAQTHLLEYADVGLMSLYIADCDALAQIAHALDHADNEKELQTRAARYRLKLATLWDPQTGIFLNRDLQTGQFNTRLSPTNFYPMLAHAATPEQARTMIDKHLLNAKEFWGTWVIPSIARDDRAFNDQNYWRGRIWGPMNYLVYLGLRNYDDASVGRDFARKSYDLFLQEWRDHGHVHENYNAITGSGDDVSSSDRFYHWGALLGYIEYLERSQPEK